MDTLCFPLSGSEPGKGVGTPGSGDLKVKAAEQRPPPDFPRPSPAQASRQPPDDTRSRGVRARRGPERFSHLASSAEAVTVGPGAPHTPCSSGPALERAGALSAVTSTGRGSLRPVVPPQQDFFTLPPLTLGDGEVFVTQASSALQYLWVLRAPFLQFSSKASPGVARCLKGAKLSHPFFPFY